MKSVNKRMSTNADYRLVLLFSELIVTTKDISLIRGMFTVVLNSDSQQ